METMHERSIGLRSNVEHSLERRAAMMELRREAQPGGGVGGSAPRAGDSRAGGEEIGKPTNVCTLRQRMQSIDWTLVQYPCER